MCNLFVVPFLDFYVFFVCISFKHELNLGKM